MRMKENVNSRRVLNTETGEKLGEWQTKVEMECWRTCGHWIVMSGDHCFMGQGLPQIEMIIYNMNNENNIMAV